MDQFSRVNGAFCIISGGQNDIIGSGEMGHAFSDHSVVCYRSDLDVERKQVTSAHTLTDIYWDSE